VTTQVHAFDTSKDETSYRGTGSVPGYVLGRWALSEHEGRLRVAVTSSPPWSAGSEPSVSSLHVLAENDGALATVGKVGGMGKGERIQAVRYFGDLATVVTFRQTDPLYVVDLSDPKAPRVAGELKIPGYSAYLHPVGPGLVLGVGRDGTRSGQILGLQMSLFDVSDPARPRRVSQVALPGSWSDAEGDHHAFTFAEGLALLPFGGETVATADGADAELRAADAGVVAVRLQGGRLSRPAVLATGRTSGRTTGAQVQGEPWATSMPAPADVPLRIFVDGGHVRTATTEGLAVHETDTLRRVGYTRY
jgi:uncharacterized secreted protein with C-terminal beta-propeller domain